MRGDMQIKYSRRIKDSGAGYGDAQNLTAEKEEKDILFRYKSTLKLYWN